MNNSAIKNELPAAPQNPVWFTPPIRNSRAFTLIELLVVISIIGIIAAMTIPALTAIKKVQYLSQAKAELGQLEAAIDNYKSALGFYPSGTNGLTNALYYELGGTAYNPATKTYTTLDNRYTITTNNVPVAFPEISGFINCTRPGAGEDAPAAKNFLGDLKPKQYGANTVNGVSDVAAILCAVGGPDQNYQPTPAGNPWRYLATGTNNPGGYDLWVQLQIGGKKYLVCNWSKQNPVNYPLP